MHVSLIVPAPFDELSGGTVYDRRMTQALRAAGHDVDVIELDGAHPLTDARARDAAEAAWRNLPSGTRPVIDGLALPAFRDLAGELAFAQAIGLVHHPTALETGHAEQDRLNLREAERRLLPMLSRVIVTSEPAAERLVADFGVLRERISVVLPGTEDAPRSTGSKSGTCHVLSVGTLVPRKGHDLLIRAFARLFDLDWHLTIAGSPERDPVHAGTLAALAEQLGVSARVDLAGEVARDGLERLWQSADIFALATHWEGYGMAIADALKRGLPVAVTSGGAAAALVPAEAGIICAVGDMAGFSTALRRIVFSSDLRREMAEAAWHAGQALPSWQAQGHAFARALDA
jgi:glycosyltransferase involved in cell wall biosynthesis